MKVCINGVWKDDKIPSASVEFIESHFTLIQYSQSGYQWGFNATGIALGSRYIGFSTNYVGLYEVRLYGQVNIGVRVNNGISNEYETLFLLPLT